MKLCIEEEVDLLYTCRLADLILFQVLGCVLNFNTRPKESHLKVVDADYVGDLVDRKRISQIYGSFSLGGFLFDFCGSKEAKFRGSFHG